MSKENDSHPHYQQSEEKIIYTTKRKNHQSIRTNHNELKPSSCNEEEQRVLIEPPSKRLDSNSPRKVTRACTNLTQYQSSSHSSLTNPSVDDKKALLKSRSLELFSHQVPQYTKDVDMLNVPPSSHTLFSHHPYSNPPPAPLGKLSPLKRPISKEKRGFRAPVSMNSIIIILSLFSYYILSISCSFFNKFILGTHTVNFPYPLLATSLMMSLHTLFAFFLLWLFYSKSHQNDPENIHYFTWKPSSWSLYYKRIIPCGIAAGLDIGLSNTSLRFVTLSLYTMVKSSVPIFSLLASFLFKLEKPKILLVLIMFVIGVGVFLTTLPNSENNIDPLDPDLDSSVRKSSTWRDWEGTIIVLAASAISGVRWTLAQLLLADPIPRKADTEESRKIVSISTTTTSNTSMKQDHLPTYSDSSSPKIGDTEDDDLENDYDYDDMEKEKEQLKHLHTFVDPMINSPEISTLCHADEVKAKEAIMTPSVLLTPSFQMNEKSGDKEEHFFAPLLTQYYVSPIICISALILSIIFEDLALLGESKFFNSASSVILTCLVLIFGAILTFSLIISEYIFMRATSVISLSVAGIFKEVLIVILSVLIFGDILTLVNIIGLLVSLIGIACYHYYRWKMNGKEFRKALFMEKATSLKTTSVNPNTTNFFSDKEKDWSKYKRYGSDSFIHIYSNNREKEQAVSVHASILDKEDFKNPRI